MDEIFKALNDPSRRRMIDELFARDGQTLGELCEYLEGEMTRFGVMSHLKVLEAAGLVVTQKQGRRKLHFLNPVPIRQVHDRWISKYTEPMAGALSRLKAELEEGGALMAEPVHIYQVFINVEPKIVWDAITDGEKTVKYFYGTRVESDWEPGSSMIYYDGNGGVVSDGEIIACDPPHRLEFTFQARWDPELVAEGPAREVWLLDDVNGATRLTIELYDVEKDSKTYADFTGGFPYIVSGLKTLVETGGSLPALY